MDFSPEIGPGTRGPRESKPSSAAATLHGGTAPGCHPYWVGQYRVQRSLSLFRYLDPNLEAIAEAWEQGYVTC